jgi:hypothetical protein
LHRLSPRFPTIQVQISPPAAQVSPFAAGDYAWPELRCACGGSLVAFLQLQAVDFLALATGCVAPLNPQIEEKKLRRFCAGAGCEILLFQSESEGED